MSEVFVIRVPREIKERMRRFRHVNWSEVAREAILARLMVEEGLDKRARAAREMDSVREEILNKYGPTDYDSTEVIRYWRDARR